MRLEKLEERFQGRDHSGGDEVEDAREHLVYRLALGGTPWVERYAKKEAAIEMHFLWRGFERAPSDPFKFCAVVAKREVSAEARRSEKLPAGLILRRVLAACQNRTDEMQGPMLVFIPELLEQPERVIRWRGTDSFVWLQPLDECLRRRVEQLNLAESASLGRPASLLAGFPVGLSLKEDGELGLRVSVSATRHGQLPSQMVEGRTEIVETISGQHAHLGRDIDCPASIDGEAVVLRVELRNHSVGVRAEKIPDGVLDCTEVLVRPLKFQGEAVSPARSTGD